MSTEQKQEVPKRNQRRARVKFQKRELKRQQKCAGKPAGLHKQTAFAAQVHTITLGKNQLDIRLSN